MTIDTTPATGSAATPLSSAATPPSGSTKPALNGDFTMFLKMLTTQMRNQDPLNPMEATDFAIQLATFSGVEQQTRTNDLLGGIAGQMAAMGLGQMAGWVGMEARVTAPAGFDGAPLTLAPRPRDQADQAFLVVRGTDGAERARIELAPSEEALEWNGHDGLGGTLPHGTYSFELESMAGGQLLGTDPVPVYAAIAEVQAGAEGAVVMLAGGATVEAGAVTALRPGR